MLNGFFSFDEITLYISHFYFVRGHRSFTWGDIPHAKRARDEKYSLPAISINVFITLKLHYV